MGNHLLPCPRSFINVHVFIYIYICIYIYIYEYIAYISTHCMCTSLCEFRETLCRTIYQPTSILYN